MFSKIFKLKFQVKIIWIFPLLPYKIIFYSQKITILCLQNVCPLGTLESSKRLEGKEWRRHSLPISVGSRCDNSWFCSVGLPSSIYLENSCDSKKL